MRRRLPGNRLGRQFLGANLAVLGVAILMIAIAANEMFINDHDRRLLMWVLVPAVLVASVLAMMLARPVARDANRICEAAMRVADGDLAARTGVRRTDELGEAAAMFDVMVERLGAVEQERGLMLSSISHDLRTPLAALRAAVEAIRDGVADDPDLYLAGMERQISAVTLLVDDLQLHTRLVSGTLDLRRARLDIRELADESMEVLRPLAKTREISLVLDAKEQVMADVDGAQLARVIRNVLDNAIRHAPDGSSVVIRLGRSGGEVTISVHDEGSGFPEGFREVAFEPFTRADPARDTRTGTAGLGLSIARGIVGAHGGTVELGAGPGGEVRIVLPVTSSAYATSNQ